MYMRKKKTKVLFLIELLVPNILKLFMVVLSVNWQFNDCNKQTGLTFTPC